MARKSYSANEIWGILFTSDDEEAAVSSVPDSSFSEDEEHFVEYRNILFLFLHLEFFWINMVSLLYNLNTFINYNLPTWKTFHHRLQRFQQRLEDTQRNYIIYQYRHCRTISIAGFKGLKGSFTVTHFLLCFLILDCVISLGSQLASGQKPKYFQIQAITFIFDQVIHAGISLACCNITLYPLVIRLTIGDLELPRRYENRNKSPNPKVTNKSQNICGGKKSVFGTAVKETRVIRSMTTKMLSRSNTAQLQ